MRLTCVVTCTDPPWPDIGNRSRRQRRLYAENESEGSAAPRNTSEPYGDKPSVCEMLCRVASGNPGIDGPRAGGGRDGKAEGNAENIERGDVVGARSE